MSPNRSELPKGVHRLTRLPNPELGTLWESIIVDKKMKDQLLGQAIINFTVRPKVSRSVLPLHGTILLVGPPGTGKTSLAKGLANETSKVFNKSSFTLIEIDPHALGSAMMGKTQKAVSDLFSQTIAETAMAGPTIVLLDEVETLAADRNKLSLQANPVDVHRATDAVLVQLDALAETHTNLLFIATSNFPKAVDSAFTSRCDLLLEIPLPDRDACEQILVDCLKGLARTYKPIGELTSGAGFPAIVDELVGLDGRAIRKTVGSALTMRKEAAIDPARLNQADLLAAAKAARVARVFTGEGR
jgi:SpoVK/Ycf46/Vps4 family AAA+-type ATPase